jgi:hypothetical protein
MTESFPYPRIPPRFGVGIHEVTGSSFHQQTDRDEHGRSEVFSPI